MSNNPQSNAQNSRNRKRPVPDIPTSLPTGTANTVPPAPSVSAPDMNSFFNGIPTTTPGTMGGMFSSIPAPAMGVPQNDMFQHQAPLPPQGNLFQPNDLSGQLARVGRGNQLVRMPSSFNGMGTPQIPQQMMHAQMPMNMNMMGGSSLLGPHGGYDPKVAAEQEELEELFHKIENVKKKRSTIPPFVLKLSSFVNDPKTDNLIRWSDHGRSFLVIDEDEFSKTLIPDLFKHNNYASFVRQLNMYGFHKVVGLADGSLKTSEQRSKPPSEYENPYFKRGLPDLMWLIQKPKSKSTRSKGKKGIKQEDPDTDKEDLSDTEAGRDDMGGGYLEGPKDGHEGGRNRGIDLNAVTAQLDAVRNHQAMISQAINRLRKDHQQLYEQSLAFQSLHDRHENSINAILTFLATVYDKSLGGHITGAVQNLFNNHGDQARAGASAAAPNGAIVPAQNNRPMRTPQMLRRTPLLLEGGTPYFEPITELSPGANDSANPSSPGNAENRNQANGADGIQSQNSQNPPTRNLFELFNNQPAHTPPEHGFFSLPTSPTTISNSGSPTIGSASVPPPAIGLPQQSQPQPPQQSSALMANGHALTPRSIAKSLGSTFSASTSRALQDHNASMAHKAQEIEELEILQKRQSEHIESLVGMMRGSFEGNGQDTDIENRDVPPADEFFNFGDGLEYAGLSGGLDDDSLNEALGGGLGSMGAGLNPGLDLGTAGLGGGPATTGAAGPGSALNSDVLGEEEIESLLKGVGVADNTPDADELVPPTLPMQSQPALSPGASSAGSRSREDEQLDDDNGETASKRRRVH